MKRGFTVLELMVVIAIIALLAAMAASALSSSAEQARAQRTRAIVEKLDQLIMEKWDSYRTRAVSYSRDSNPRTSAMNRLSALRELQRMELPDRKSDIVDEDTGNTMEKVVAAPTQSSVLRGYFRRAQALTSNNLSQWDTAHQGSECLYLILSGMKDGDKSAIDFFTPSEIGDTDGDGMPEILDGWGNPIAFLRWAPGYTQAAVGVLSAQSADSNNAPDPFDPLRVDGTDTFVLKPLIFSAGADGLYDVNIEGDLRYTATTPPNDPYFASPATPPTQAGQVGDKDGDGIEAWSDNITNHSP